MKIILLTLVILSLVSISYQADTEFFKRIRRKFNPKSIPSKFKNAYKSIQLKLQSQLKSFKKTVFFLKGVKEVIKTIKTDPKDRGNCWKVHGRFCGKAWCGNKFWDGCFGAKNNSSSCFTTSSKQDLEPLDAVDACCKEHDHCCNSVSREKGSNKFCNCNKDAGACFKKASEDEKCQKDLKCNAIANLGKNYRKELESCYNGTCFEFFVVQRKQLEEIKRQFLESKSNIGRFLNGVLKKLKGWKKVLPKKIYDKFAKQFGKKSSIQKLKLDFSKVKYAFNDKKSLQGNKSRKGSKSIRKSVPKRRGFKSVRKLTSRRRRGTKSVKKSLKKRRGIKSIRKLTRKSRKVVGKKSVKKSTQDKDNEDDKDDEKDEDEKDDKEDDKDDHDDEESDKKVSKKVSILNVKSKKEILARISSEIQKVEGLLSKLNKIKRK